MTRLHEIDFPRRLRRLPAHRRGPLRRARSLPSPLPLVKPGPLGAPLPRTGGEKTALAGFAKPISPRLNPTGRTVTLNVPLVEGETRLGEIVVRIEPDGAISVPKAALVKQLAPVVEPAALGSLQNVPDRNGFIALGDLSSAHFRLEYDPSKMELAFSPRIEQRPHSDLRFAGNRSRGSSGHLE